MLLFLLLSHMPLVKMYFRALGGHSPLLVITSYLALMFASEITLAGQTWFLGYWAWEYTVYLPSDVPVVRYVLSLLFNPLPWANAWDRNLEIYCTYLTILEGSLLNPLSWLGSIWRYCLWNCVLRVHWRVNPRI